MADIPYTTTPERSSSDGGMGSFSYVDLSVYGQRGSRSIQVYQGTPSPQWAAWLQSHALVAGAGGGARAPGGRKNGSRAQGYNPDGCVILKLYKVG